MWWDSGVVMVGTCWSTMEILVRISLCHRATQGTVQPDDMEDLFNSIDSGSKGFLNEKEFVVLVERFTHALAILQRQRQGMQGTGVFFVVRKAAIDVCLNLKVRKYFLTYTASGKKTKVSGSVSELSPITLDKQAKMAAGIPAEAEAYVFAFPVAKSMAAVKQGGGSPEEVALMEFGGFVYLNGNTEVLQINVLSGDPCANSKALYLSAGRVLPSEACHAFAKQQDRFL